MMAERIEFTYTDDEGCEHEASLAGKYEVCDRCQGKGSHDCWNGGMTRDEMDEQGPDFFEEYMRGDYDRVCVECEGRRVMLVPDEDRCDKEVLAKYEGMLADRAAYAAEIAAELRAGC